MNKNVLSILIFALVGIAASIFIPWFKVFGKAEYGIDSPDYFGHIIAVSYALPLLVSLLNLKSAGLGALAKVGIIVPSLFASGFAAFIIYIANSQLNINLNPFGEGNIIGSGLYLIVLSGLFITIRSFGAGKKG